MQITVIPRVQQDGTAILFLPDDTSNPGMIMCYVHVGQHSEACLDFYYETKPDKANACADLLAEYKSIPPRCELVIRKRRPSWRTRRAD